MKRGFTTFITFRGEPDKCARYTIDGGPGSGCQVDWWFDNMSPEDHNALNITAEEEEEVAQLCIKHCDENRDDI